MVKLIILSDFSSFPPPAVSDPVTNKPVPLLGVTTHHMRTTVQEHLEKSGVEFGKVKDRKNSLTNLHTKSASLA